MNIAEKLDRIQCRTDHQARRVVNVSMDIADIGAEELERGVTLERLEQLNVPVFRYATQVTIHGRLPDFNRSARPGGYKALFLNANGTAGVRYAAIDAGKKAILCRACRAAGGVWHANITSQGLEIFRTFIVKTEEERAARRQEAKDALGLIPTSLFFGDAFACALAYGMGYGVGVSVGAIYEADLWELVEFFSGFTSLSQIEEREQAKERERDAYFAELRAQNEAAAEERLAEKEKKLAALRPRLVPVKDAPKDGMIHVECDSAFLTVRMETVRGRLYYTLVERNLSPALGERRLAKKGFPWPKALAAGRVFRVNT